MIKYILWEFLNYVITMKTERTRYASALNWKRPLQSTGSNFRILHRPNPQLPVASSYINSQKKTLFRGV